MKKKFGKMLIAAFMVCAVGSFFSSCNDYVSDVNAELQGQIADLNSGLNQDLTDLEAALQAAIDECKANCAQKMAALETAMKQGDNTNAIALTAAVAGLEAQILALTNDLKDVKTTLGAKADTADVKDLYEKYQALQTNLADNYYTKTEIDTKLADIIKKADDAMNQANKNADSIRILNDLIIENQLDIDTIQADIIDIKDAAEQLENKVDSAIAAINDSIADLKAADEFLQEQIDDINEEIEALWDEIEDLKERLDIVEDRLNKRISSVVVNGAYSPVIGYFNLPTGVKSNILAAYYSTIASPAAELLFPTIRTANYVDPTAAFSDAEAALLGFAETTYGAKNDVLVGTEGNAGKIYLTINPNDVDTTGVQLKLKNSIGEESAMILGPLTKSDEKLSFGYTRAATNGFYEVSATMQADAIEKAKIRVELEDLKTVIKDFATIGNGVNLSNAVTTLYAAVNDIADAYAVEAIYTDSLGEHSVYSDYGLAAVAIKPLSYNSLADLNVTSFPGMGRVSNLVNKVFDKVGTISIPDLGLSDLQAKLEGISFGGAIGDSIPFVLKISVPVTIPSMEVPVPSANPPYEIEVEIPEIKDNLGNILKEAETIKVPVDPKDIMGTDKITIEEKTIDVPINDTIFIPSNQVLGELGTTLDDVDALLSDVNAMLKSFNTKIDNAESKLNNVITKVEGKLNSFLDKLNGKLCAILNSVNSKLQPTLLVGTTDGFSLTSSIKGAPSQVSATSFTLIPTSYTAEILAPAFKKYVAVTAAYDANGNLDNNAAKAANTGDLNTVLDGHTRAISFNGQSGYTYEITYSAVDFSGYISNTKYYIEVK